MHKDIKLMLEAGANTGTELPGLKEVEKIYADLNDASSIITTIDSGLFTSYRGRDRAAWELRATNQAIFRAVGEYRGERVAALEDAITGMPIYVKNVMSSASLRGSLRMPTTCSGER